MGTSNKHVCMTCCACTAYTDCHRNGWIVCCAGTNSVVVVPACWSALSSRPPSNFRPFAQGWSALPWDWQHVRSSFSARVGASGLRGLWCLEKDIHGVRMR